MTKACFALNLLFGTTKLVRQLAAVVSMELGVSLQCLSSLEAAAMMNAGCYMLLLFMNNPLTGSCCVVCVCVCKFYECDKPRIQMSCMSQHKLWKKSTINVVEMLHFYVSAAHNGTCIKLRKR